MPTTTATKPGFRVRWMGAAVPQGSRNIRVHSVFARAVNLRLEGCDLLIAITSPSGEGMPHAMVLGTDVDFRRWRLERGDIGRLDESLLRIKGGDKQIEVELLNSKQETHERIAGIVTLGAAFDAAVAILAQEQSDRSCDLRIGVLLAGECGFGSMGERLAAAAQSLSGATQTDGDSTRCAVSHLIGLGPGLTPAGDDFLCGFMAAAICSDHAQTAAIRETMEKGISATNEISGSLLRCAARGYFHRDLRHAASAIAAGDESGAVQATRHLCMMGHSSGADMATGFLFGLFSLIGR